MDIFSYISGLITGLILFIVKIIYDKKRSNKLINSELLFFINKIFETQLLNNIGIELYKLKQFFLKNPKIKSMKWNENFYQKWLTDTFLENDFSLTYTTAWDKNTVNGLKNDLANLIKKNKLK